MAFTTFTLGKHLLVVGAFFRRPSRLRGSPRGSPGRPCVGPGGWRALQGNPFGRCATFRCRPDGLSVVLLGGSPSREHVARGSCDSRRTLASPSCVGQGRELSVPHLEGFRERLGGASRVLLASDSGKSLTGFHLGALNRSPGELRVSFFRRSRPLLSLGSPLLASGLGGALRSFRVQRFLHGSVLQPARRRPCGRLAGLLEGKSRLKAAIQVTQPDRKRRPCGLAFETSGGGGGSCDRSGLCLGSRGTLEV